MINWLNEPLNETDIYFDVVSKYYEDLMELIERHPGININVDPDYFKIKFLHLLVVTVILVKILFLLLVVYSIMPKRLLK